MNTLIRLSFTASVLASASVIASDVTIPNTFTTGTPAVASQINANFTALENAVDDNDARLDALEPSANPIVVNCTSSPNGLQAALSSPRTGKLIINFSGACNPVNITRSNVEIIGASRATASIGGGAASVNSLLVKNASNIKLASMTISRTDDQGAMLEAWNSSLSLDDVLIDFDTGGDKPEEGVRILSSSVEMNNSETEQALIAAGSSVILQANNIFDNTFGGSALQVYLNSSVAAIGAGNAISSSGGNAVEMSERSSLAFHEGNTLSGNIYMTDSTLVFVSDMTVNGSLSADNGSSVLWEGADGGPSATPAFNQMSIQGNSVVSLQDANLTVTGNFNIQSGGILNARRSNITSTGPLYIQSGGILEMSGSGSTKTLAANVNMYENAQLRLDQANLNGTVYAARGSRIATNNGVAISGAITMDTFSSFFGNNTDLNGGGIIRDLTSFSLNGAGSSMTGLFELWGTSTSSFAGSGATIAGATFNCTIPGHGDMSHDAFVGLTGAYGVCGNADSDPFFNYEDDCPAVFSNINNGCP